MIGTASKKWPYEPNILPLSYQFWEPAIVDSSEEESKLGHAIFDIEWLRKGAPIWLLQIADVYGLMLQPAGTDSHTFSRVGVFHLARKLKFAKISEIKII